MSFPATAASFITPKTSKLRAATRLYECVKLYFPARGPYRNVESSVSVDMLSHFAFPFSQAHGIFTDPWMLDFYCELVGGIYRNIPWILWEGERFLSCFFPISHPIPSIPKNIEKKPRLPIWSCHRSQLSKIHCYTETCASLKKKIQNTNSFGVAFYGLTFPAVSKKNKFEVGRFMWVFVSGPFKQKVSQQKAGFVFFLNACVV